MKAASSTNHKYFLFEPRDVQEHLWGEVCRKHGLDPDLSEVLVLPSKKNGAVGGESRRLYFVPALSTNEGCFNRQPVIVNRDLPITRIISFGVCNAACPYCERECQFVTPEGIPVAATPVPLRDVSKVCEGAIQRGEIIRFSGGDPVMYPEHTLALSEYLWERHQVKVSIAHNGSGPDWVEKMLPYLSSAAVDLKAVPEKIGYIMGVGHRRGEQVYQSSLKAQRLISSNGILLDVRTPVFGETTIEEMYRLAEDIAHNNLDCTFWTWRLYKSVAGAPWTAPQKEKVIEMLARVSARFPNLWMGLRVKWTAETGMLFFRNGNLLV